VLCDGTESAGAGLIGRRGRGWQRSLGPSEARQMWSPARRAAEEDPEAGETRASTPRRVAWRVALQHGNGAPISAGVTLLSRSAVAAVRLFARKQWEDIVNRYDDIL
jgi:hypothetical protein